MEDEELVQKFQSGNLEAFDLLYERYKNQAIRAIYLITNSCYDCEDIMQEAFVKCYLHIGELKDPAQFKSWFFQILYRSAWQYLKKKSKETPTQEIAEYIKDVKRISSLDEVLKKETKSWIRQEIEKLDVKHRSVVVLYYYNELSIAEIAKIMGCFEGTVKSRLATARKKLRVSFKGEELGSVVYLRRV
ncbi:MAG: RNA polymerase sigma factor [Velocimicrobium sp.]